MAPELGAGYLPVIQTGLQTLIIIAAGRLAATRGLFEPASTCRTLNRFVVVVCLPALQFWLLAIKTDMRNMEHWRAVGAFMLWTLLVQLGCAAWVMAFERGRLSRVGVHSLVLAANNTGILAPVVLEAAIGPSAAAIGMLATIALYFQQLPAAMVLFELERMGMTAGSSGAAHTPVGKGAQAKGRQREREDVEDAAAACPGGTGGSGHKQPLLDTRLAASGGAAEAGSSYGRSGGSSGAASALPAAAAARAGSAAASEPGLRHVAQLVAGNALMWTTGAATAASMLGLHTVLDPEEPTHIAGLGCVEGTLAWLARCSVPVSLFAMGLWTASDGSDEPGSSASAGSSGADKTGGTDGAGAEGRRGARGGGGGWSTGGLGFIAEVVAYLAVKLLALPVLMLFVNSLLGIGGRLGRALMVLTCVPVGQMAFVVSEQYGHGAAAVTWVMQAGLLLMLPHVIAVLATLRWAGLYAEEA
ncbi:hypothetical protein HYH03_006458 [Edaphochlamys debaryana]|uniref:Auxin efflux carrier n=1 Tax=Edaphochlamys debaryana TaxID=47281 RepID=A0A835YAU8_9CHLO|nr:hypothetical protein HYH03_006458 [Edaphochlamys debaryana]|eukprot:KAG2495515.1 hypothetical protein HYH03_006458 [Edaphochlamys debaryana]